jgi:hypothetical protein
MYGGTFVNSFNIQPGTLGDVHQCPVIANLRRAALTESKQGRRKSHILPM